MVKKGKWTTPGYDEKFGSKFSFHSMQRCRDMRGKAAAIRAYVRGCTDFVCCLRVACDDQTFRPSNRTLPNRCGIPLVLQLSRRTAVPALQSDY